MEGTLNAFMAKERTLRWQIAIRSRCAILMKIYDSLRVRLPFNMALPNVADLALVHSARSLILETPYDTIVTLADFNVEELLEFLPTWLFVADEAILDIVRNSSIGPDATHSILPLATTLFHCSTCSGTLHYPRVLVHSCLQMASPNDGDESENLAYMFSCLKCRPWDWTANQKQITFDELAHQHTKALLALYHFQPIPSYDDLQNIDPFIECSTTVSSAALDCEREVMRMTMAVSVFDAPLCTRLLTYLVPSDWHLQDVWRQRFSMACSRGRRPRTSCVGGAINKCLRSFVSCSWRCVAGFNRILLPALRKEIFWAL